MGIKKFIYHLKPPCKKCPYKLGSIQTIANPCVQCKIDNYKNYEILKKQLYKDTHVK